MMRHRHSILALSTLSTALMGAWQSANALNVTDNFTGVSAAQQWILPKPSAGTNSACMTAGDGTGAVPKCAASNDTAGYGALRLTDTNTYQYGGIVSSAPFDASSGVQITFTTYTYGGNSYTGYKFGDGKTATGGADGMAFFLIDADIAKTASAYLGPAAAGSVSNTVGATMGASGGSLGYTCSNAIANAWDGVIGGYIGLGIDEFGNFLNKNDNTSTGPGGVASRIGLRGAGVIAWPWLNANYPDSYPTDTTPEDQKIAVQNTCKNGYVMSGQKWATPTTTELKNYAMLTGGSVNLPSNKPIPNEAATTRDQAWPIIYNLKITSTGKLSLSYSYNSGVYQPIMTNQDITAANGTLPSSLLFGFTGSTGGGTNYHEISCFQAGSVTTSSDSAAHSLPTGQYRTGAQVYIASYNANNWFGQLTATNLNYDTTTGAVTFAAKPNWDASCALTGGSCATTESSTTALAPDNRQILSYNGTTGVPFKWAATATGSTLTAAQMTALSDDSTKNTNGENRLKYLRGDRSNEQSNKGIFRTRTSVLGDIINSSPTWVGPPSAPYPSSSLSVLKTWSDNLYPTATLAENAKAATAYSSFQSTYGARQNVVYTGANDGLLHGFRAGYYDTDGNFVGDGTPKNDGVEMIAYMPAAIVQSIHNNVTPGLDYSSMNYGHSYTVDGPSGTGDLFYGNNWHTWLVGGLGFGGQAIYALDVTNPTAANFAETEASTLVLGEWSYDATKTKPLNNLGKTYGAPQIRRFHNGQWGAVFGNGWCFTKTNSPATANDDTCKISNSGHAGIFVMLADKTTGAPTFKFIDTGVGAPLGTDGTGVPNGIAFVTPADLDGDHITDYVYAGDLLGNIWRFDLTSSNSDNWTSTKLFSTSGKPVTTQLTVSSVKTMTDANPRIVVNFGTGVHVPQSLTDADRYSAATQSVYGVWDWNMATWNGLSSTKYASVSGATAPTGALSESNLKKQTFTTSGSTRSIDGNTVCWRDKSEISGCTTYDQYGWYADFGSSTVDSTTVYEQVIYSPIIAAGALIFNTTTPAINLPLTCKSVNASGWTFALDPATGSGLDGFFSGNTSDTLGYAQQLNATGSPSVVNVNGQPVLITKDGSGTPNTPKKLYPASSSNRVSWIQLR